MNIRIQYFIKSGRIVADYWNMFFYGRTDAVHRSILSEKETRKINDDKWLNPWGILCLSDDKNMVPRQFPSPEWNRFTKLSAISHRKLRKTTIQMTRRITQSEGTAGQCIVTASSWDESSHVYTRAKKKQQALLFVHTHKKRGHTTAALSEGMT